MNQLPHRTWDRRRSGTVWQLCEIGLGVLVIVVNLWAGGNTAGGWAFVSALSFVLIVAGLFPFIFVAGHISYDANGRFSFKTSTREVAAERGAIVSAMYKKRPTWLHASPVVITTTGHRIWVTQWIDHKPELRSALLDANPEMKLPAGAFK
jgi:Na+(H+)/acetate symporter ActP